MRFLMSLFFAALLSHSPCNAEGLDLKNFKPGQWNSTEEVDEMGRGTLKMAVLESANTVTFGFPYHGEHHAILALRKGPTSQEKMVALMIDGGRFACGITGCTVTIRFDSEEARRFSAVTPSDGSTDKLLIHEYSAVMAGLKRAKKIKVEAAFFAEGLQIFEFRNEGLKWPDVK